MIKLSTSEKIDIHDGGLPFDVLSHTFYGGMYCKRVRIKAGGEVVQHAHIYDHLSVLAQGRALVEVDGEGMVMNAPSIIKIPAGKRHSVIAMTEVTWLCLHATNETDPEKIDSVLKKKAMRKLGLMFHVEQLVGEIEDHPELWDQYPLRTLAYKDSPHREAHDIWIRYRDFNEFDQDAPHLFSEPHKAQWYSGYYHLPALEPIINRIMEDYPGGLLGGVLITKIPAGKQVYPHIDLGWHAEFYHKKILVLLKSAPGQKFCFEHEEHEGEAGEVFEFINQESHWVVNNSDEDRISLILAVHP